MFWQRPRKKKASFFPSGLFRLLKTEKDEDTKNGLAFLAKAKNRSSYNYALKVTVFQSFCGLSRQKGQLITIYWQEQRKQRQPWYHLNIDKTKSVRALFVHLLRLAIEQSFSSLNAEGKTNFRVSSCYSFCVWMPRKIPMLFILLGNCASPTIDVLAVSVSCISVSLTNRLVTTCEHCLIGLLPQPSSTQKGLFTPISH